MPRYIIRRSSSPEYEAPVPIYTQSVILKLTYDSNGTYCCKSSLFVVISIMYMMGYLHIAECNNTERVSLRSVHVRRVGQKFNRVSNVFVGLQAKYNDYI